MSMFAAKKCTCCGEPIPRMAHPVQVFFKDFDLCRSCEERSRMAKLRLSLPQAKLRLLEQYSLLGTVKSFFMLNRRKLQRALFLRAALLQRRFNWSHRSGPRITLPLNMRIMRQLQAHPKSVFYKLLEKCPCALNLIMRFAAGQL